MSLNLDDRQYRMLQTMGLGWLEAVQPRPAAESTPAKAAVLPGARPPNNAPNSAPNSAPNAPTSAPRSVPAPNLRTNSPLVTGFIESVATKNEVIRSTGVAPNFGEFDAQSLPNAVSACRACGLCEGRRNAVFGAGSATPLVMLVTDAPTEQDDASSAPFADQSGQLLDAMLGSIQLQRSPQPIDAPRGVFVTHAVKCRPSGDRSPSVDELAACSPILRRQIELLAPKLILAAGRVAVQQLLGTTEPLGKLRGRVHAGTPASGGVAVIVTYHPSYLLRSPSEKAKAWEDLCRVADTLDALEKSP